MTSHFDVTYISRMILWINIVVLENSRGIEVVDKWFFGRRLILAGVSRIGWAFYRGFEVKGAVEVLVHIEYLINVSWTLLVSVS